MSEWKQRMKHVQAIKRRFAAGKDVLSWDWKQWGASTVAPPDPRHTRTIASGVYVRILCIVFPEEHLNI